MVKPVRLAILLGLLATGSVAAWGSARLLRSHRIEGAFKASGDSWPPRSLILVAFKAERRLELWGDGRLLKTYPILAASGGPGPKRREGDRQVPEGIYRLTTLNPQSRFHLSIRVDYPDAEDRREGCTGSDIYLHGGAASIGCIAVGDEAIEEIYGLASLMDDRRIIILPWNFQDRPPPPASEAWLAARYQRMQDELLRLNR